MKKMANNLQKVKKIRKHIDRMDHILITSLAERLALIEDIAKQKKKMELPIKQEKREQQIMKKLKAVGKAQGLDNGFVEEIFLSIFNEAKRIQKKVIKGK